MKTSIYVATILMVFVIFGTSLGDRSYAQTVEGYTFIRGTTGPQVCLGRWIPSRDVALPGVCEGQIVDVSQLTAISSRLSADRLDQILFVLTSMDQKLALSNDQVKQLIETTVNTQTSIDQQMKQVSDLLGDTINKRFEALPEEILANDVFRAELLKLKEDILREVETYYSKRPASSTR